MVKNVRVYIIGIALLIGLMIWKINPISKNPTSESNLVCLKTDSKYQESECEAPKK